MIVPVLNGFGAWLGGNVGVNVSATAMVCPFASVVVYVYTVGWPVLVLVGAPTGPCCWSVVVGTVLVTAVVVAASVDVSVVTVRVTESPAALVETTSTTVTPAALVVVMVVAATTAVVGVVACVRVCKI